jgi:hypothetical protein
VLWQLTPSRASYMLLKMRKLYAIVDTRHAHAAQARALIFVTLIVKILSCNKIFLWSTIKITLIVLLFNNQESRSIDVVEAHAIPRKLYAIEDAQAICY